MTECERVKRQLWEFLDGELPRGEAEWIHVHLAACARCRPRYRYEYRFLNALTLAYARRELPTPEFVIRLRRALAAIGPDPRQTGRG